jgi:hypothetical protein
MQSCTANSPRHWSVAKARERGRNRKSRVPSGATKLFYSHPSFPNRQGGAAAVTAAMVRR